MTDDKLNKAIAGALFPAFGLNGWYTDGSLVQQAANIADCYRPRDFCRDGNAMLALIEAIEGEGYRATITWSGVHVAAIKDIEDYARLDRPYSANDLPRAVATSAAKALGVWEE